MDTMEQDPEEIPMDQVLAEIRQMLSAQTSSSDEQVSQPAEPIPQNVDEPVLPPISDRVEAPASDYFLLTPAMRCDLPSDSELSEAVQKQTTRVLNKLQQQSVTDLSPALVEWLNANLPEMIEKALSKHSKSGGINA